MHHYFVGKGHNELKNDEIFFSFIIRKGDSVEAKDVEWILAGGESASATILGRVAANKIGLHVEIFGKEYLMKKEIG